MLVRDWYSISLVAGLITSVIYGISWGLSVGLMKGFLIGLAAGVLNWRLVRLLIVRGRNGDEACTSLRTEFFWITFSIAISVVSTGIFAFSLSARDGKLYTTPLRSTLGLLTVALGVGYLFWHNPLPWRRAKK